MLRQLLAVVLLTLGLGWSGSALAWGDGAHRTICEIAVQNLTPKARAEVARLLGASPVILAANPAYARLGWACTYPDHPVAGGPGRRSPEHYVSVPRTTIAITSGTGCPEAPLCVLSAIAAESATLRSPTASDRDKAVALIFLGHFVGDLHMPLHASFADDREGSLIDGKGLCETSLHWTWDNCIFEARVQPGKRSDADVDALAAEWSGAVSPRERAQWTRSEPWQWAAESFAIARDPRLHYCVRAGAACNYSTTQPIKQPGLPNRVVQLDAAYMDYATPIIRRRMTMAGIRLAALLNRLLDPR